MALLIARLVPTICIYGSEVSSNDVNQLIEEITKLEDDKRLSVAFMLNICIGGNGEPHLEELKDWLKSFGESDDGKEYKAKVEEQIGNFDDTLNTLDIFYKMT